MNKGITIIICTFNGVDRLSDTIGHIARQSVPGEIAWEVILADNASTDESSEFSEQEWHKYNLPEVSFKTINEPKPGKLYALQHAIKEARYEYLIICDDDNWLAPDYVKTVYPLLETMPKVAAIGGQGIPVTAGAALPEWFQNYHSAYAVGPQANKTGILKSRKLLWGAGLSTRKSLYLEMYKTYPSFLPEYKEKNILSAEDTEYCIRLVLKGYDLYYDAALVYQHFIPDFKLTTSFRDEKLMKGFEDAYVILRKYYAAMRATLKTEGRPDIWLALLLIAPINYLFSFSKKRAEKARDTLFYLLPFRKGPDSITTRIKAFIKE
ncbi:glycosyltransferase [Pedobacter caeni]|uniref:Glycosyl transferase family 2 n=1 Tax=Pedobacter caeni TaxID=288992 RepID=A0A1M5D2V4_9SPHI|nr:glycosyltransferase [Pedobacter caeni]SHF61122.1 Glycosyl transferase family 2 [Pedobacter caeni]